MMNIYQKLIQVRKTCAYLKKDNKGHQFNYVSSSQALGTLRGAMDDQGLLLVPEVVSYEVRDHVTQKGNKEYFTIFVMSFTWINVEQPEEKIVCQWHGQGLDSGEKGVGKAMTYAEKYFLLKFFNIATDKDDPDAHQRKADQSETQPTENKDKEKPWYNDFEQEREMMVEDINAGRMTGIAIINRLSANYIINKKVKDSILALDKNMGQ